VHRYPEWNKSNESIQSKTVISHHFSTNYHNLLPPSHPWQSPATVLVRRFLGLGHSVPAIGPRSRLFHHRLAVLAKDRGRRRCRGKGIPGVLTADFMDPLTPCLSNLLRHVDEAGDILLHIFVSLARKRKLMFGQWNAHSEGRRRCNRTGPSLHTHIRRAQSLLAPQDPW